MHGEYAIGCSQGFFDPFFMSINKDEKVQHLIDEKLTGEAEACMCSSCHGSDTTEEIDMSGTSYQDVSGVAETSLIPLAIRAYKSQRPDALIKDEEAEALVCQMDQDYLRRKLTKIEDYSQVAALLPSREFDRLLDERFPYQYPEPRLGKALAVRHSPFFPKAIGIFHYQL
jgi:hypothetical protein